MPVVQEAFFVPDDIATGIATGIYRRIGGVVRYASGPNKGQIVKHLDPVEVKVAEKAQGLGVKALQFVQHHKKGTVVAVSIAGVIGISAFTYNWAKKREPRAVTEFRAALRVYIEAIRHGSMDIHKIDALMAALEELKKHKDYKKISIQLSTEDLETLVGRIYDYTVKLAKDNGIELTEGELDRKEMEESSTIIDLQKYLKAQKKIFESAA